MHKIPIKVEWIQHSGTYRKSVKSRAQVSLEDAIIRIRLHERRSQAV
jgi:hypothetical protein